MGESGITRSSRVKAWGLEDPGEVVFCQGGHPFHQLQAQGGYPLLGLSCHDPGAPVQQSGKQWGAVPGLVRIGWGPILSPHSQVLHTLLSDLSRLSSKCGRLSLIQSRVPLSPRKALLAFVEQCLRITVMTHLGSAHRGAFETTEA